MSNSVVTVRKPRFFAETVRRLNPDLCAVIGGFKMCPNIYSVEMNLTNYV